MADKLRVTLIKSPIGHTARTRGTLRALGLRRIGQTVEINDTEQMRGLTRTVRFLLRTEEPAAASATASRSEATTASQPEPAETGADAASDGGDAEPEPAPAANKPKRAPRAKKESSQ
jgi:large subunit ribosomal protein L30